MSFSAIDTLKGALGQFFRENFYSEAVVALRKAIREDQYYIEHWQSVVRLIVKRELPSGYPLNLIHNDANLPLEENSDQEAYKWLTLMVVNAAGEPGSTILDYADLCRSGV